MDRPLQAPFLDIDGVRNFRDFGGYRVADGRTIPRELLYRSGAFADMSVEGQTRFARLNIKVVVDLRRGQERQASPSQFGSAQPTLISSSLGDGDGVTLAPHLQFIKDGDLSIEACHAHMLRSYRRIPWEPQHGVTYRAAFETLRDGVGPLLLHCAAGKDRTGIVCGLIHHVLGVDPDVVLADYLLSNNVPLDTDWLTAYAQRLSKMFTRHIDPESLLPMLGVHPDYLREAWAQMDARHGGLDSYLDHIGVDAAMREAVRTQVLQ
jgi:protein-tyrosine phosphatase